MKQIVQPIRKKLCNDRGDISIFTCFFVEGVVMLISFLLTYAIRITCINIRNGAKMELNNLSASIYADIQQLLHSHAGKYGYGRTGK